MTRNFGDGEVSVPPTQIPKVRSFLRIVHSRKPSEGYEPRSLYGQQSALSIELRRCVGDNALGELDRDVSENTGVRRGARSSLASLLRQTRVRSVVLYVMRLSPAWVHTATSSVARRLTDVSPTAVWLRIRGTFLWLAVFYGQNRVSSFNVERLTC